jgi:hypothetical protein
VPSARPATFEATKQRMAAEYALTLLSTANISCTINLLVPTIPTETTISPHRGTNLHQPQKYTKTNLTSTKVRTKLPSRLLRTDRQLIRPAARHSYSPHPCHRTTLLNRPLQQILPTCLQKRRRCGRHNKAQRNGSVSVYHDMSLASKHTNTSKRLRGTNLLIATDVECWFSLPTTGRHAGGRY